MSRSRFGCQLLGKGLLGKIFNWWSFVLLLCTSVPAVAYAQFGGPGPGLSNTLQFYPPVLTSSVPTNYSVGSVLTFSYQVRNPLPGSVTYTVDSSLGPVVCPPGVLSGFGGQTACTSSYAVTSSDLSAGQVVNRVSGTAQFTNGNRPSSFPRIPTAARS
jgi:hypothetical protein